MRRSIPIFAASQSSHLSWTNLNRNGGVKGPRSNGLPVGAKTRDRRVGFLQPRVWMGHHPEPARAAIQETACADAGYAMAYADCNVLLAPWGR